MTRPIPIPPEVAKAIYDLFEPGYLEHIGLRPECIATAALAAARPVIRSEALEEAAKVAEDASKWAGLRPDTQFAIAAAIRALKEK